MLPDSCVFIANNIEFSTISSSNNENEFDVLSDSINRPSSGRNIRKSNSSKESKYIKKELLI